MRLGVIRGFRGDFSEKVSCKGISKEIRHMTEEERQRAKEKEEANTCTQSNLKKTPQ